MGTHLKNQSADRVGKTPKQWLAATSQMGDLANKWSGRGDIIGYVGDGAGQGAPACFNIPIAEMEINVELAFSDLDPKLIGDMRERDVQFEFPVASGAILHEAMHARHTLFPLREVAKHQDPRVRDMTMLLEETRIEFRGVQHYPRNKSFLRACAMHLVMGDLKLEDVEAQGAYGIARLAALTLARVDAGVLQERDVDRIRKLANDVLGEHVVEGLKDIWIRAQDNRVDDDAEPMIKLAEEWVKLLVDNDLTPEDWKDMPGVKTIVIIGMPNPDGDGEGEGGEGDEDGQPKDEGDDGVGKQALQDKPGALSPEEAEALRDALDGAVEDTELSARGEGAGQEAQERAEGNVKARASAAAEQGDHEAKAADVFGKGTGPSSATRTGSRLVEQRAPSGKERAAAVKVARMLEKIRYQERLVTPVKSVLPPGRLRTSAAVQQHAQRTVTGMSAVEPWRSKKRQHVEDPRLAVGMLVDISGSRSHTMEPMAVSSWVMSEACRRVEATMAMVYYGDGVFPVLKPGQHLKQVNVYSAPDGTERFNLAFQAMDGAVNLLHSDGARLLIISSDMYYTGNERTQAKRWVQRCVSEGIGVLIMTFGGACEDEREYERLGAQVMSGSFDPASAAMAIGAAIGKALAHANAAKQGAAR